MNLASVWAGSVSPASASAAAVAEKEEMVAFVASAVVEAVIEVAVADLVTVF